MGTFTQFPKILRIIQDYYNKKVRFNLLEHELGREQEEKSKSNDGELVLYTNWRNVSISPIIVLSEKNIYSIPLVGLVIE